MRSAAILTLFGQRVLIEEGDIETRIEGDKIIVSTTARLYPMEGTVKHVVRPKEGEKSA